MTKTGPLVLSGAAAGVSVDGPIASVSARVRAAGGEALEVEETGCALSAALAPAVRGMEVAIGAVAGVSETCAVDVTGAGADD